MESDVSTKGLQSIHTRKFWDSSSGSRVNNVGLRGDFSNDIRNVMKRTQVGLPNTSPTPYLPAREQKSLVNASNIRQTLGPVANDGIEWIEEKAPKTFMITVLAISERIKRGEAMYAFWTHDFTDTQLPVQDFSPTCNVMWDSSERTSCNPACRQISRMDCHCAHPTTLDCFHHRVWSTTAFEDFQEKQWRFLLQTFDGRKSHYFELEPKRILPFLPNKEAKRTGQGHFAMVQSAQMPSEFLLKTDHVRFLIACSKFL
jgi:hypothetical protein